MLNYRKQDTVRRIIPNSPYTGAWDDSSTVLTIGVGLFGVAELADSVSAYYGGRIGYLSLENTSRLSGTLPPGYPSTTAEDSLDGYTLAPTIGLEYHFSKRFSIGGEAALAYTNIEGDDGSSQESTATTTNIIFRYMFQ